MAQLTDSEMAYLQDGVAITHVENNTHASDAKEIVAANASHRIAVLRFTITGNGTTGLARWRSNTTDLHGGVQVTSSSTYNELGSTDIPIVVTEVGEALNLHFNASGDLRVTLTYKLIK